MVSVVFEVWPHPDHRDAQRAGRKTMFREYRLRIAEGRGRGYGYRDDTTRSDVGLVLSVQMAVIAPEGSATKPNSKSASPR